MWCGGAEFKSRVQGLFQVCFVALRRSLASAGRTAGHCSTSCSSKIFSIAFACELVLLNQPWESDRSWDGCLRALGSPFFSWMFPASWSDIATGPRCVALSRKTLFGTARHRVTRYRSFSQWSSSHGGTVCCHGACGVLDLRRGEVRQVEALDGIRDVDSAPAQSRRLKRTGTGRWPLLDGSAPPWGHWSEPKWPREP